MTAASNDEREWAVMSWHPNEGLRIATIGPMWTTEEAAREHYEWLRGPWRDELQRLAEENEASGFEGGNEAWYRWNNERSGKKQLRFALASRPKPEAATVEQQEEGFRVH